MKKLFNRIRDGWFYENTNGIIDSISNLKQTFIESEIDRLHSLPKYQNKLRVEKNGFKVYSQNDEDGIIHEIFNRIGTTNKVFIEFNNLFVIFILIYSLYFKAVLNKYFKNNYLKIRIMIIRIMIIRIMIIRIRK